MRAILLIAMLWAGQAQPCMHLQPEPLKHCRVRSWRGLNLSVQVNERCDRAGCTAVVWPEYPSSAEWAFSSDRGELIPILGGRAVISEFSLVTPTGVLHPGAALSPDQLALVPRGPCGGRYEGGRTNSYRRVGLAPTGLVMEAMQSDGSPPVRVLLDASAGAVKRWGASADGCSALHAGDWATAPEGAAWVALATIAGQLDFTVEPARGPLFDGDRRCLRVLGQLALGKTAPARVAETWLRGLGLRGWRSARFVGGITQSLRPALAAHFCVLSRRFQLSVLLLMLLPIGTALLRRLGARAGVVGLQGLTVVAAISTLTYLPSLFVWWGDRPAWPDQTEVMSRALETVSAADELEVAWCPLGQIPQKPKPPSTSMVRPVK